MKKIHEHVPLILGILGLLLAPNTQAAPTPAKKVLNDWYALGSACRAKHDLPGNVRMEEVSAPLPQMNKVKFTLDNVALSSDNPSKLSPLQFGKECSIRLNINPPAGKRLKRLIAITSLHASKAAEVDLLIHGELKLGAASLGHVQEISKVGQKISDKVIPIQFDTDLGPPSEGDQPMPELKCGEAKIIGFDYTFIAKRTSEKDAVLAEIGSPRTLEITAELENCTR